MPAGFGRGAIALPPYNDYVIRENQLEDYLDIFRGVNTRNPIPPGAPWVHRAAPAGGWYYNHPFFPPPGVAGFVPPPGAPNPTINYILIAEAALPLSPVHLGAVPAFGGQIGDKRNTYFYNVEHLKSTPYLEQVRKAFHIRTRISKPQVLWLLAQQGVLLLDLYPYAIDYNDSISSTGVTIRNALISAGVSSHFWGIPAPAPAPALAPETIGSRIHALAGLCDPNGVKLAFIAPPILSHFLAEQINAGALGAFGATIRMGVNATVPPVLPAPGHVIPGPPPPASLVGLGGVVRPLGGLRRIPYYACTCYDGAGNPNSLFIQNALLP